MVKKQKDKLEFHELLKKINIEAYNDLKKNYPDNCKLIDRKRNFLTGFYAEAIACDSQIIIAYRGTDTLWDWRNNIAMAYRNIPKQATDALRFYDQVKERYPNSKITVTGHSLGGSLTEVVGGLRKCDAVTFNSYGTKNMFKDPENLSENNVINYVVPEDPIAMSNVFHVGITYEVPYLDNGEFAHKIEAMGDLSQRKEKSPEELRDIKERLHPRLINWESRLKMGETYNKKDVKSDEKPQKTPCVGSYYVSGYTRADGTEVSGYVRTCGAAHESGGGSKGSSYTGGATSNLMGNYYNKGSKTDCFGSPEEKKEKNEGSLAPIFSTIDLLRSIYKGLNYGSMTEWQRNQLLEDLI